MNNEKYKSTIGFTDLLFNILVGFAFLFIIAFLLIKPESKEKDFDRRAEFIIVLEWDAGAKDDIDLYVEDPLGALASFRNPRVNFSHLDKDDLGSKNDTTVLPNGIVKTIPINREVMTIRGNIPGEWIVNAHYFSDYGVKRSVNGEGKMTIGNPKTSLSALTVKVELHRVNPYDILGIWQKKFYYRGQEETFVRFTIDKDGMLIGPFGFEKIKFVSPSGHTNNNNQGVIPHGAETERYFTNMNIEEVTGHRP